MEIFTLLLIGNVFNLVLAVALTALFAWSYYHHKYFNKKIDLYTKDMQICLCAEGEKVDTYMIKSWLDGLEKLTSRAEFPTGYRTVERIEASHVRQCFRVFHEYENEKDTVAPKAKVLELVSRNSTYGGKRNASRRGQQSARHLVGNASPHRREREQVWCGAQSGNR